MPHKLLLADDSVTIQRVVDLTFSGEDVEVVAVGDGEEAIARIPAERPDVVLADIAMPKRSGYEVAAFVKGRPDLQHIPVLLLAGAFEPVDEARAREVKSDGVLVKPFEPQQVVARVRELLEAARPRLEPGEIPAALRSMNRPSSPRTLEFPRRDEGATSDVIRQPSPDPATAAPGGPASGESLDDYFERLDAAFTHFDPATAAPPDAAPRDEEFDDRLEVPTVDDLIGPHLDAGSAPVIDLPLHPAPPMPSAVAPPPVEAPDITPTRSPGSGAGEPAPSRNVIADAFEALLAVEEGEPGARPVRLTAVGQEPAVTDALVEEVTRRVLERLAPDAVRDVVAEIVSDVAERLVREEIERVRNRPVH